MKLSEIISRIFFPEKCALCGEIIPINQSYCSCSGNDEVKIGLNICRHCGQEITDCTCEIPNNARLPHIAAVYYYDGLTQTKITQFKFRGKKELYKEFGDAMSERAAIVFADADFDIVTFVPMKKEDKEERGYNQSELLCKRVGEKLFIPSQELLLKTHSTLKQHTLSAQERTVNIIGSIRLKEECNIKGKKILLCDDIKTTGSTLKECAHILLNEGAADVYCLTIAITPYLATPLPLTKQVQASKINLKEV